MANSFFFTVFSWVRMLNSEAWKWKIRAGNIQWKCKNLSNLSVEKIRAGTHLLLKLSKLVLVLWNLLQRRLDAEGTKHFFKDNTRQVNCSFILLYFTFLYISFLYFTYNFPRRSFTAIFSSFIWGWRHKKTLVISNIKIDQFKPTFKLPHGNQKYNSIRET